MNTPQEHFFFLVGRVLDGAATAAERATFRMLLREHPELIDAYREQTDMDTLACWKFGRALQRVECTTSTGISPRRKRSPVFWRRARVRLAAAAAVLLTGVALWHAAPRPPPPSTALRPPPSALRPPSSVVDSPVMLVARKEARGLELPQTLPGRIRLAQGEIKVRLPSGVEMTLLSPLELDIENEMDVRLLKGQLVAWVPRRASGFTVHAPGLTAWDIGTVFSVATKEDTSDLFVFKGSVQVFDSEGAGVDLCEAGEGVRALIGMTPFKVVAEGEAAKRLVRSVRGYAALAEPLHALRVAQQICEQWTEKYVPEEATQIRARAERQIAQREASERPPFSKSAWVRPSVPAVSQARAEELRPAEEEENMNKTSVAAVLAATMMAGAGTVEASAPSAAILVDTSPVHNRHWTTVFTNAVPLRWEWPTNANRAQLEIVGMNGSVATNFTDIAVTNWVWPAFATSEPSAEDVYDLTLTFLNGNSAVVGAQTSRLAVVSAAFGQTTVVPTPESRLWPSVKENRVIPYDAEWAAATADATNSRVVIAKQGGITETNALPDTSGYLGWKVRRSDWGYGTFNLALTFPGTVTNAWDATLVRVPDGMMIQLR